MVRNLQTVFGNLGTFWGILDMFKNFRLCIWGKLDTVYLGILGQGVQEIKAQHIRVVHLGKLLKACLIIWVSSSIIHAL